MKVLASVGSVEAKKLKVKKADYQAIIALAKKGDEKGVYAIVKPYLTGTTGAKVTTKTASVKTTPTNTTAVKCPSCGSTHLQSRGTAETKTATYKRYQCQACSKWTRKVIS